MREENIKVKITIPFPFGKPDKNGNIYSEEAVKNAVNNLHKELPIIYRDNESYSDGKIIGNTIGNSHIVTWDFDNQTCNVGLEGIIYFGGTSCIVNEINEKVITDFRITGIGLSL